MKKTPTRVRVVPWMLRMLSGGVLLTGFLFCLAVSPANAVSVVEAGANVETASNSGDYASGAYTAYATYSQSDATAWASVDAASGTLKAYAVSSAIHNAYDASAGGNISDYYTIHGPSSGASVSLSIYLTVGGSMSVPTTWNPAGGTPSAFFSASIRTSGTSLENPVYFEVLCESGSCESQTVNHQLVLNADVIEGIPFEVATGIGLGAFFGGTADFGSTAALSFDLPDGTWITSDGGYTQTDQPNTVPEPSTLLFVGLGMFAVVGMKRKFQL